jgi:site-specific DNA-methyltransferase (adenine-specific)
MVSSQLICADCIVAMKDMADDSVDSIVTDPPYGLEFMGKKWDYDVPSVEIWEECFRVLKPGGHLLCFGGSRTYHRLAVNIEDAQFTIRDQIQWLYGSGFPKNHSVSLAMDKAAGMKRTEVIGTRLIDKAPATPEAKQWDGWGTALKPAHEPIVMARKPIEGTVAENVLEHGTGAINIDNCRIKTIENLDGGGYSKGEYDLSEKVFGLGLARLEGEYKQPVGRFPANVILTHHPECKHEGSKVIKANSHWAKVTTTGFGKNLGGSSEYEGVGERPETEVVEKWECHPDCPLRILDEQSGDTSSTRIGNPKDIIKTTDNKLFGGSRQKEEATSHDYRDKGGASRFFYCAKPSQKERNAGCERIESQKMGRHQSSLDGGKMLTGSGNERSNLRNNFHPTVKPVDLMRYLCRLVTPPEGIVLDPFMGSGTTGIAANLEGFNFIGIDMEEEYVEIARARIAHSGEYVITEDMTMKRIKQPTIFDFFDSV